MLEKVGPLTNTLITSFIDECHKDENQEELKSKVIDPMILHIANKLQPYVIAVICIFIILFILITSILILIVRSNDIKYKEIV